MTIKDAIHRVLATVTIAASVWFSGMAFAIWKGLGS